MKEWMKTASATFAGGAVAVSLVAIPTFVWLPREFDELRASIAEARDEAADASAQGVRAADASDQTLAKIDSLVVSIARMDAKAIGELSIDSGNGTFRLSLNGGPTEEIEAIFPPDVLSLIVESGRLSSFRYSDFGGSDWIFVEKASFNEFSLEQQQKIETALDRNRVRLLVE